MQRAVTKHSEEYTTLTAYFAANEGDISSAGAPAQTKSGVCGGERWGTHSRAGRVFFQEALQLVHRGHDIRGRIRSRGVREPALFLQASKEVCALRRDLRRLRHLRHLFIQLRERDGHPRGEGEGGAHRPYRCYPRRATVNDSLPARTIGSIESIPLNPTIGIQRSEKLSIRHGNFRACIDKIQDTRYRRIHYS